MKTTFYFRLFFLLLFFTFSGYMTEVFAEGNSDSLIVVLNKEIVQKGDTLFCDVKLPADQQYSKPVTLHLWIEEIKTGRKWHYRYPLIKGLLSTAITVGDKIKDGDYAFNFAVQEQFFSLHGKINNPDALDKKNKTLTYVLIAKGKANIVDVVKLDAEMNFTIYNLLFQDTAFTVFSRPGRKKNDLELSVATPLDSSFVPENMTTKFLKVCSDSSTCFSSVTQPQNNIPSKGYAFKPNEQVYKTILPEVTLTSKSQKTINDFEKENVSGIFSGFADFSIDGITDDELSKASDLFLYLSTKIPGLRVEYNSEDGLPYLTWRKKQTEIYLNEIKMDSDAPIDINPSDIALIRVFRPGTALSAGSGEGGSVCIYMKNGAYSSSKLGKYSFYVKGYTGAYSVWQ